MREGWINKTWADVLTIINGKNQTAVESQNGTFPIYGSGGIMGYASDWLCPENTVIIGRKGNINKPLFVTTKLWNVDTAFGLCAKEDLLIPKYLFYFCKNYDFERHNRAVTIPSLTKADLLKISMSVPSIKTQHSIVSELDKIDELISIKKSQLNDLDALVQSIFTTMFGDPVENEKGWEINKLGNICTDIKYGTSKPACLNGQYKYLRMCNLTYNGYLDLSDIKTIDIPDDEIEKCIVRKGDILFNRTNSIELVGKTCMFEEEEPMVIAGYLIRVRLDESILPVYLARAFNLPSMKKVIRNMAKGAVNQANINSKELASIYIPLPPISLQQTFAARILYIEQLKKQINSSIYDLETLLASRMQYWFN